MVDIQDHLSIYYLQQFIPSLFRLGMSTLGEKYVCKWQCGIDMVSIYIEAKYTPVYGMVNKYHGYLDEPVVFDYLSYIIIYNDLLSII